MTDEHWLIRSESGDDNLQNSEMVKEDAHTLGYVNEKRKESLTEEEKDFLRYNPEAARLYNQGQIEARLGINLSRGESRD